MRQFVRESKHLRRLEISPVDENQRSERITQHKSTKLVRIEFPLVGVPNNAVDDDDYSDRFRSSTQSEKRRRPRGMLARPSIGHSDCFANPPRSIFLTRIQRDRFNEWQSFRALFDEILVHPILPPLHRVDCLKKIRTGATHTTVPNRSEIRNRK